MVKTIDICVQQYPHLVIDQVVCEFRSPVCLDTLVIDSEYRRRICGLRHLWSRSFEAPALELPYRLAMMEEASLMLAIRKLQLDCGDETCNVIIKCIISMAK